MAAFKQHITVSSCLGAVYVGALWGLGTEWVHAILAGILCGVSGMLPDLDSASGRPVRELFGVTAVVMPLLLIHRLALAGVAPEGTILAGAVVYVAIRFGAAWLFRHLTVHRGMFHSVPAAVIAAEIVFLAHNAAEPFGRLELAGGVFLGYLSHLVLDEMYSVDAHGLKIRLNKAAGSALKFASRSVPATAIAWLLLAALTYLVGVDGGYLQPVHFTVDYPTSGRPQAQSSTLPAGVPQ